MVLRNIQNNDRLAAIIYYSLLFVLFLNVFPHVNALKDTFFYLSLALFLFTIYVKKNKFSTDSPLSVPLLVFTIWALITSVFAQEVWHSFHSFYSHLIRYLLFYFLLINIFKTKKDIAVISWNLVIASILFFTGALIYFYIFLGNPITERFGFQSFSINIVSFFSIFSLVLSIRLLSLQKQLLLKIFLVAGGILLIVTTILTQSRGAFISLVISLLIMLSRNKKRMVFFFFSIVFLSTAMLPVKNRISMEQIFKEPVRVGLLNYSLEIVKENPILGAGFSIDLFKNKNLVDQEKIERLLPKKYQTFILPHSWPLSILIRTGVVGFMLFLIVLISLYRVSLNLLYYGKEESIKEWALCFTAALTMFVISGLFEPVFIHSLDTIFYTICALITILWKINKETEPGGYLQ